MILAVLTGGIVAPSAFAAGKARHVVVMVWDGMRPDFITETNTPTLYQLVRQGVNFQHHHPVYLSSTEVNGTAISTGSYPANDGIVGNNEYRPELFPLKYIHTEDPETVHKGDEFYHGNYVRRPTLAEIVRQSGGKAVVAGAKGVVLLLDRGDRSDATAGANVYAGQTLPASLAATITSHQGEFPGKGGSGASRNDWTTQALTNTLWADGVPELSFLWMCEPDFSQHQAGPGSERALAGIHNSDENLARVLRALDQKGVRGETDIFIVSDHGFSTVAEMVDLAESLKQAGFNTLRRMTKPPAQDDIVVVSNGGTVMLYVTGHDEKVIQRVVNFLQGWNHTGVIFTRKPMAGTFALEQVHLDASTAPDMVVSMRWTAEKSKTGTPGLITSDLSDYGPGQGNHASLSRFDMHNTLIAAGPDFRSGIVDDMPTGNVDVAPTVLWILGKDAPKPMDGRVLTEALAMNGPKIQSYEPRHLEAACVLDNFTWHQYLIFKEVNGVFYCDEGNGYQAPK